MGSNKEPLLGSRSVSCDSIHQAGIKHVGSLGLVACTSNLVCAVFGAGQLVLPYAISKLGLSFGVFALVFFTLLSVHSLNTLTIYELHFAPGAKDCIDSFPELVVRVVGSVGTNICSAIVAFYAWGGALSFLVILKTQVAALTGWPGPIMVVLISAGIIFPLSSFEDLSPLKPFAILGCISAVFITAVVLIESPWDASGLLGVETCQGPQGTLGDISGPVAENLRWWPNSVVDVAAALPLLAFALNSSWAFIPILCTLSDKRPSDGEGISKIALRTKMLIWGSNSIIFINYFCLGVYGYLMFCGRTTPNILDSFSADVFVLFARCALSVQLTLALPMRFFVTRRTIANLRKSNGDQKELSQFSRIGLSAVLVGSAAFLAALPLRLETVLGITSSVCASMIIYIMPAMVDLWFQLPGRFKILRLTASLVSLVVGLFVFAGGLAANILGIAVGS